MAMLIGFYIIICEPLSEVYFYVLNVYYYGLIILILIDYILVIIILIILFAL